MDKKIINDYFETGYKWILGLFADLVKQNRKDTDKIVAEIKAKNTDTLEGYVAQGFKQVTEAINSKEITESVEVTNTSKINEPIVKKLNQVIRALKKEVTKLDKEIVINTDLTGLEKLFKGDNTRKDIIASLKAVQSQIKNYTVTDYTMILDDIATLIENINIPAVELNKIEKLLTEIRDKQEKEETVYTDLKEYDDNGRIKVVLSDKQVAKMGSTFIAGGGGNSAEIIAAGKDGSNKTQIVTNGAVVSEHNPFPTDGDSVYVKDVKTSLNNIGTFTGDLNCLFNNLDDAITDTSSTNPKYIEFYLERPISTGHVGLVAHTGNFSNVKIILKDRQGTVLTTKDESGSNTHYTARRYAITGLDFCCVRIEFHTADPVTLSFLRIAKYINTSSRIKALNPAGTEVEIQATTGGNLKMSIEEADNQASPVYTYVAGDASGTIADVVTNTDKTTNIDGKRGLVTSSAQYARVSDTIVKPVRSDSSTEVLMTVDYVHHEMHDGSHFFYTDALTLGNGVAQDYLLTTPNTTTWPHFTFAVNSSLKITTQIYEASDKTGTTAQTSYSNNRNTAGTATMTIHKGTSGGTTDGTLIWACTSGSSAAAGKAGTTRLDNGELILKQNTKYIVRVTSGAASNDTCVDFTWYEHANRN